MKRIFHITLVIALAAISAASCVTEKKIAYLQDMTHGSQIELENRFEAVISPYDELEIYISCFDSELAQPFNINSPQGGGLNGQNHGYLVDQYGNIQVPVIGNIHAAGMTRLKLQEKIQKLLSDGGYISNPYVMVRFKDFKVFFLGANGGKVIQVPNERCTFLEALAMSGDMDAFTKRDKVAVMREINGTMQMRYLDPRSSKVFEDPFFMLQQNDFIITYANVHKNIRDSFEQWTPLFSIISTLSSLATIYMIINYGGLVIK